MDTEKIDKGFNDLERSTEKLIDKYNRTVDSIKSQEFAIEKVKNKIEELQYLKDYNLLKPNEEQRLIDLNKQLEIMYSKLNQTKESARETGKEIKDSLNKRSVKNFGTSIDGLGKKIDNFKNRIARLISGVAIFNLLRSSITNLRNDFISLLKSNDEFNGSLNQIKANLMTAFAPIYNACLPAINSLMTTISKITGTIAIFVSQLFGMSLKDSTKQAKDLSKALDKTSKSGEKASGSLSSIDKLDVIADNSSSKNTGGASTGIDYNGEIQYSEKLLGVLNKIKEYLSPIIKFIKEFQEKHGTLATAILIVAGALGALFIIKKIKDLFKSASKPISGMSADFTDFFKSLGKATEAIAILGGLALVINSITNLIDAFSESGMSLGQVAGLLGIVLGTVSAAFIILLGAMTLLEPSWQSIAGAVVIFAGLAIVLESVANLLDAFSASGMTVNDVSGLMLVILTTLIGLMASVALLGPAMTAGLVPFSVVVGLILAVLITMAATLPIILNATADFITKTAPSLCILLATIGNLIKSIIHELGISLPPIIKSVGILFDTVFNGIAKVIQTIGDVIVNILNTTGSLVTRVLSSILIFITELGPAINTFVDNAISATTKLINFMISGIEYLVNTLVIGGVNSIIKGINAIGKYVDIIIPLVPNMSIPRFVPRLATGAVIPPRHEFAAVLGDQKHGTNIETPASLMADVFDDRLAKFFEKFANLKDDIKEIVFRNFTIVAQFGDRDFKKIVVEAIRLTEKEIGKPLFVS